MSKIKTTSRDRIRNGASLGGAKGVVAIRTTLALVIAALVVLHQRLLLLQTSSMLASLEGRDRHRFLTWDNSTNLKSSCAGSKATGAAAEASSSSSSTTKSNRTLAAVPTARAILAQMTTNTEHRLGSHKNDSLISIANDDNDDDEWLTMQDFDVYLDAFSDSWYMSLSTFLETDRARMQEIEAVEEACFVMFESREEKVRMALDWLDFGVEHMSTWWKVLAAPGNAYAHRRVVQYLDRYVLDRVRSISQDGPSNTVPVRSLLRPTLALVAFQRYQVRGQDEPFDKVRLRSDQLTVSSLSATIASLLQAGMGRIVVVGHNQQQDAERPLVHQAFSRFAPNINATTTSVYGTQLAYATVSDDVVRTDFMAVNVPRGALLGLRRALEGTDREWTSQWLGPPNNTAGGVYPWKFVYLTEPDTILHVRPASLLKIERMLRKGMILVPHRLQPVPYEGDVPESNQTHTFITREQVAASTAAFILELDAAESGAACCDEQMGTLRPGPKAAAEAAGLGARCGWDRWWLCGFGAAQPNSSSHSHQGNHSLILDHYQLIRLREGTGVTLVSGSSHGRRCFPTLNATCKRRIQPRAQQQLVRPKNPWITPKRLQERRARKQNASVATSTT
jgi:hypothetical protein